jgi:hypothetical protein
MAEYNPASWANLNRLHAGQKIRVVEVDKKKHTGTFVSYSDSAISMREGAGKDAGGDESIPMKEVRSVMVTGNNRRLRNTLIGTAVGAGAGAGVGAAAWERNGFLGGKGDGAAVGAALGVVIGTVIGVFMPSYNTVYSISGH